MGGLELLQAPNEGVVLGVADLRVVELVVALVVVRDLGPELGRLVGRGRHTGEARGPRYAPTLMRPAVDWSATRAPRRAASFSARPACETPWPARPQAGVTSVWARSWSGSAPASTSEHHR